MNEYKSEDYIILSMDITGSEYQILDKMVRDGSTEFIDDLYIEFSDPEEFEDFSSVSKEVNIKKLVRTLQEDGLIKGMDSVEDCVMAGQWVPCVDYNPLKDPAIK
jgi:hypothetical protein